MNANQALAKARKLYGKDAYIAIRRDAPNAEERVELKSAMTEAVQILAAAKVQRDELRCRLLSDSRYMELCQRAKDAESTYANLMVRLYTYKVEIGVRHHFELFTSSTVKVRADSLEEAFDKALQP